MIRKNQGAVEWLEFELLKNCPGIVHGSFLRHGGVSGGPYSSLNSGGGTEDAPENIRENKKRMEDVLQIKNVVSGMQVHGDRVVQVENFEQAVGECDALITEQRQLGLMIRHADCQAAIFYDPEQNALANVHCGWRGAVKNIYRTTILTMSQTFGTKPEDILVCISPSLGPEHSEFKHYKDEFPESFWRFQVRPNYFDLWAIARHQLETSGVLSKHIEIAGYCTYANKQDCYSYRRDKIKGNHATYAMLK